ncbi:hypothetical protein [Nocardioides speluncae]|uniref:hypothetical protein n=1 Tax=Nocardioides speluncae TaxID=2670337 RepID=UPI000D68C2B8|nr:hypothetical protein [Nocardioides speluncae]
MDNADSKTEAVRRAISIMTAWLESEDDDGDLMIEQILAGADDGEDAEGASVMGLVSLCGHLLIKREREVEITPADTLKELALKYQ